MNTGGDIAADGPAADADGADLAAALRAMPDAAHMSGFLHDPAVETVGADHADGARLSSLTTLRLGGPCADVVVADTQELLVSETRAADDEGTPLLVVSGGSNMVVADAGWSGRAMLVRTRGIHIDGDQVTVAAGEPWDEFVARMVTDGRAGVEALSGIPGSVGSTPIQNVGAYGQDVAETITAVLVWDRRGLTEEWLAAEQCGFGYRTSVFKRDPHRWLVLAVRFRLPHAQSFPIRYSELARVLDVEVGQSAALPEVREAVLALRAKKGMVLDAEDHDTWSAGSFFTNPLLTVEQAERLPVSAPRYPTDEGMVKTSAAWLIEQAGIGKGFRLTPDARAGVSTKHTLALTNRGGASTEDVLALARHIRAQVNERFAIELDPEPVLVGCQL